MKAFNGYDDARRTVNYSYEVLPEGAYTCIIKGVKFEEGKAAANGNKYSDRLIVLFDIAEGEFQDFFRNQYDHNSSENKKYKGRTVVYIPKDDGTKEDNWTKNDFAKWTYALEESNSGYIWDWDESKWKDKLVGIVFGRTGTVIDGKEVVFTEARFPVTVSTVRSGDAPQAKFKAKNGYGGQSSTSGATDFMNIPEGIIEDLPF